MPGKDFHTSFGLVLFLETNEEQHRLAGINPLLFLHVVNKGIIIIP